MDRGSFRAAVLLATLALAACKGPVVPSPLVGQTRYLCCNLHYERPEVTDVNYQQGALVPLGTRVQILEVRRSAVKFQPEGHPPITAVLKHGRKIITMETFIDRLLVEKDPRAKLPRAAGKKGAEQAERVRKAIEAGQVEVGMTREQVLMALGYPPAHRTPSLDAPQWTYWQNHWATFIVVFDGDRVSRIQN